ncbi:MAG TPA: insulinase family protein, partial [Kofleriaceae bacterium]
LVDSGACVSANLTWQTQMNTGPISIYFVARPDKVDACVTGIKAELDQMKAPYITDDELHRAAHTLEVQDVQSSEKPSELAHTLTFWWTSAGLDYYRGYVDHMYTLTVADTVRYINNYITGKPYVLAVMVSPEMQKAGLDQAHFDGLVKGGK